MVSKDRVATALNKLRRSSFIFFYYACIILMLMNLDKKPDWKTLEQIWVKSLDHELVGVFLYMQASLSNIIEKIRAHNQPVRKRAKLQNCSRLVSIISLRNLFTFSLAFANNYGSNSFWGYWLAPTAVCIYSSKSFSLTKQVKRSVPQPGRIRFISKIIRAW